MKDFFAIRLRLRMDMWETTKNEEAVINDSWVEEINPF